ncbi:MAG TPA: VOC family protein [Candidatus Elarobacter sp.]|jgi:catechol 2,3-dioxygenase-like lactoylglutathione lyase family enzyme
MPVTRLDHINVLTSEIDAARDFFVRVLGVTEGYRPPFRSPGHWLYAGDRAIIHISDAGNHEQTHVEDLRGESLRGQQTVDHVAFGCEGYAEMTERFRRDGIAYHEADVPATQIHQVFVDGPGGIGLELIFAQAEVALTARGRTGPRAGHR